MSGATAALFDSGHTVLGVIGLLLASILMVFAGVALAAARREETDQP